MIEGLKAQATLKRSTAASALSVRVTIQPGIAFCRFGFVAALYSSCNFPCGLKTITTAGITAFSHWSCRA